MPAETNEEKKNKYLELKKIFAENMTRTRSGQKLNMGEPWTFRDARSQ